MNKRETKRLACRIVAQLVQSYVDIGNVLDWPEADPEILRQALLDLSDELYRRGDG